MHAVHSSTLGGMAKGIYFFCTASNEMPFCKASVLKVNFVNAVSVSALKSPVNQNLFLNNTNSKPIYL